MSPALFQPIKIGQLQLAHRVVLPPMTRCRADLATAAPLIPVVPEYYAQRASVPGGLLIAEATAISLKAGGLPGLPGIWSDIQVDAWKKVVEAVHARGAFVFLQLIAIGRRAMPMMMQDIVGPSAIAVDDQSPVPRELTEAEIVEYIESFGVAAENAVLKAGFDGVEIHGASGFLVDEFTQDISNTRNDRYGGSLENRARFGLEVADRIVRGVGAERVGYRISPWSAGAGMGMADPKPQFSYLISQLKQRHPTLAYLHAVEARLDGLDDKPDAPADANDVFREIWAPKRFISAGGYTRETGIKTAEEKGDLIAFGRWYTSNPDLPKKLEKNLTFNKYDRDSFYIPGDATGRGYTDFPVASE